MHPHNADFSGVGVVGYGEVMIHQLKKASGLLGVVLIMVLYGYCIGYNILLSLTQSKIFPDFSKFYGPINYIILFNINFWYLCLYNMAFFAIWYTVVGLGLGLLVAVLLDRQVPYERLIRSVLLFPFALSFVVTGIVWKWILHPERGFAEFMHQLGYTDYVTTLLTNPRYAMGAIVLSAVWKGLGLFVIIFTSGLKSINQEIWMALRMEGVSVMQSYRYVVLPMIRTTMWVAVFITSLASVGLYDLIVAQTNGGPGFATWVPAIFIVRNSFAGRNASLGAAAAVSLTLIVLLLMAVVYVIMRRRKIGIGLNDGYQ